MIEARYPDLKRETRTREQEDAELEALMGDATLSTPADDSDAGLAELTALLAKAKPAPAVELDAVEPKPATAEESPAVADDEQADEHEQTETAAQGEAPADLFRRDREVFTSPQFYALSPRDRDLLLYARFKFTGNNNGRLELPLSDLVALGFDARSRRIAMNNLRDAGFIVETREQVCRRPAAYALTWYPTIRGRAALNTWRTIPPKARSEDDGRRRQKSCDTVPAKIAKSA
jgi:hypothetical protein